MHSIVIAGAARPNTPLRARRTSIATASAAVATSLLLLSAPAMAQTVVNAILPKLMSSFQTVAPGVQLSTVDMFPDHTQVALGTGEIDLAIGYFADFGPNFYAQRIFQEWWQVVQRFR